MKARLMFRDRDFDLESPLPWNEAALTQDLELTTLFNAMAGGDKFLFEVARRAILVGCDQLDTILYRQQILRDCLKNAAVVRDIYQIPLLSIENKKKHWLGIFSRHPGGILASAVEMLQMFLDLLVKLRKIADNHAQKFQSEGMVTFFSMLQKELDDAFFAAAQDHLKELKFNDGVLLSVQLGPGNEGSGYILRKPNAYNQSWTERIFGERKPVYSFSIHPRDDQGARALQDLKDRGVNLVANALAQSADHIDAFLNMLRTELAFYIGCLNLHEQLTRQGNPLTFPAPVPVHERQHTCRGLYDVCLALTKKQKVVGNELEADGREIMIITGANQGGKSTFLRGMGLAQLMMQCGMFVGASSFSANLCRGLFTHYRRKEDASMKSGKLDEELARMSQLVDHLTADAMVLFNESFAATNEREGSEIARQITTALLEKHIKVIFVTHQFAFAHSYFTRQHEKAIFLRAERRAGGGRTYKLIPGEPLSTSFGEDVYRSVFTE